MARLRTRTVWQIAFGAVLGLAVLGIVAIGVLFPGRPRTLLTNVGPTFLLLVAVVGLVGLLAFSLDRSGKT